jgi:hypothetical protein
MPIAMPSSCTNRLSGEYDTHQPLRLSRPNRSPAAARTSLAGLGRTPSARMIVSNVRTASAMPSATSAKASPSAVPLLLSRARRARARQVTLWASWSRR